MPSNTGTFTFDRPETIDDATFSRIVFIRPLELAVQPIIDHNVKLISTVRRLRPWYRGEHDGMEPELLSTLLDPDANHACEMLKAFIAVVKRYNPGEFPAHCCKMRELEFTTRYLIHSVKETVSESPDEKAKKRILQVVASAGSGGISRNELTRKTQFIRKSFRDKYLADLIESRELVMTTGARGMEIYRIGN